MAEIKNNIDFMNNLEIIYDDKDLITKGDELNIKNLKIKVLLTKDNKVVIVNDLILKYYVDKKTKLKDITLDMLLSGNYDVCGKYVLLSELMNDYKGKRLFIEVIGKSKKHLIEKEILDQLNKNEIPLIVTSSNKKVLKYFRKKKPNVIRGYHFEMLDGMFDLSRRQKKRIVKLKVPFGVKADFVEYDINSITDYVKVLAQKKNIKIASYLIDTDAKYKKAKTFSYSYIVKNNYCDREEK